MSTDGTAAERPAKDRGTFSMFTVLFVPMVLLFAGLLFDGGLAIHARQRALDIAEQAARAGATGEPVLEDGACGRALGFVAEFDANGYEGACALTAADEVTVQVAKQVDTIFLGLIGVNTFTIEVEASAHPEDGAD
jgi:Flp pilus assembly protein TadG